MFLSRRVLLLGLPGLLSLAASSARGADDKAGNDFFEKKIRPALVKHCFECHSQDAKKLGGKLLLDSREDLRQGGESGAPLVEGKPDESLLIQSLRWENDLEMPPKEPLPETVIADFVKWIEMGAPDPRKPIPVAPPVTTVTEHWSFQPVKNPAPPEVADSAWPRDPLDRFALAAMEREKLAPAGDAPPETLIRRLSIDLTGLPPTFGEVAAFSDDFAKNGRRAVERLVDDLLASPRFGERWGRHWLDVARYGESNGNDGLSRNPTFPHAWRYRDYVIRAFNEDTPYDRFIAEQIAGDLLPAEDAAARDRLLVATGFLALGAKPAKAMNTNFDMDVVDDQIAVIGTGIMGISVACARCHDHKHDPIPTRDYYALAGIFKSTETMWGVAANEPLTAPATDLHVLKAAPKIPPPPGFVETVLVLESNTGKPKPLPKPKWEPGTPLAMGVRDRERPGDCQVNVKGESSKLGDRVPRGFLTACVMPGETLVKDRGQSGRLELARWLTRKDHPLTARVMANRVWHHLFGQAIVGSPDDFGIYGDRPTHPELLDHLASRFMAEGWSVKKLIRSIVLSRTYQLDSAAPERLIEADPENRWLARHSRRRLDAESIRDAILRASGDLDLTPGDGSIIRHRDILLNLAGNLHEPSRHRSVYLCMLRNSPPPELAAFDLPDGTKVTGERDVTTLPTQSLFLINSPFVVEQSRILARRLIGGTAASDPESAAAEAIRRVLNREPASGEVERAVALLRDVDAALQNREPDAKLRAESAWTTLCQGLFAASEFRFVD
ncbi:MAG: PSD1 domain-containing protein [Verrucomicrobiae bacterium]|nr:PSD1 domain-containing protein [Verrucomicrobiae bacterium]